MKNTESEYLDGITSESLQHDKEEISPKKYITQKHISSSVIGFYRMGASWEEIWHVTRIDVVTLKLIVAKHLETNVIYL